MTGGAAAVAATREALHSALDPCSVAAGQPMNLVEMGLVEDVRDDDGEVVIALRLTSPLCHMLGHIVQQIDDRIGPELGGRTVRVVTDNGLNWDPSMITGKAREERERRRLTLVEIARSGTLPSRSPLAQGGPS